MAHKHVRWLDPTDTTFVDGLEVFLYLGSNLIDFQNVALGVEYYKTPYLGVGNYAVEVATIWEDANGHKHCEVVLHKDFSIGGTNHGPTPTDSRIEPPTGITVDDN